MYILPGYANQEVSATRGRDVAIVGELTQRSTRWMSQKNLRMKDIRIALELEKPY